MPNVRGSNSVARGVAQLGQRLVLAEGSLVLAL